MARPRTDIDARVLDAARKRFLEDGVDGASLRTIAKDAGTSIGMIFYYFPTKDDLFFAVVERVYGNLVAEIDAAVSQEASLRDRLRAISTYIGSLAPEEIDVVRLIIREALVSSPRLGLLLTRFRAGHIGKVAAALAEGIAAGEVDPNVPPALLLISTFAMSALPQLIRHISGGQPPFDALPKPEVLADAAVRILLEGIGAKAEGAKSAGTKGKRAARARFARIRG